MRLCHFAMWAVLLTVSLFLTGQHARAFDTTWQTMKIGAGGYVIGMDISPDGSTRVVRTDTAGAYIWTGSQWKQLVTKQSMPASTWGPQGGGGVYEIRVAPSLPTRLYMAWWKYLYRSDDSGNTWTQTGFPALANGWGAGDAWRMYGQKMAVDPVNPDVVYVGTEQNGLFVTVDGGANWTSVSAVPLCLENTASKSYPGYMGIAFDRTSGTLNGRTKTIYVPSFGNGVYRSGDAGATWTNITTTTGPKNGALHAQMGIDGTYYCTEATTRYAWRFTSGVWTNITPKGTTWVTVATDPNNASRIVLAGGATIDISYDRGATWQGQQTAASCNSTDMPWQAYPVNGWWTVGSDAMIDPKMPNFLWIPTGRSVAYLTLSNPLPKTIALTDISAGIENLCAYHVISPPNGKPVTSCLDFGTFYVNDPSVYSAIHGPVPISTSLTAGFSLDYATTSPNFVVGVFEGGMAEGWTNDNNYSGYSTDGGQTWTPFKTPPPLYSGGIAASTPKNFVWVPGMSIGTDVGYPYVTNDGGATWTACNLPNPPSPLTSGWPWAWYFNQTMVCADRVNAGTFYMYNMVKGTYRSTDGGKTWANVSPKQTQMQWVWTNAKIAAMPGHAGYVFMCQGQQGNYDGSAYKPLLQSFLRTTDGGVTWNAVPNVGEVITFGFGKGPAGSTYPSIYICGFVNKVYGLWRSDDDAKTWTQIGDYPTSLAGITDITGDANVYGTVYVGLSGNGWAYGQLGSSSSPPPPPPPPHTPPPPSPPHTPPPPPHTPPPPPHTPPPPPHTPPPPPPPTGHGTPPTGHGTSPPTGHGTPPPTGHGTPPPTGHGTPPPTGHGTPPPTGHGTPPPTGHGTPPPNTLPTTSPTDTPTTGVHIPHLLPTIHPLPIGHPNSTPGSATTE